MASYLRPGLTAEGASKICMDQCGAMCCRGPLLLELQPVEMPAFETAAQELGVKLRVNRTRDGGGWLKFSEHAGERCPMLQPDTMQCRIYDCRPSRCREFPERPTPGCAISGG